MRNLRIVFMGTPEFAVGILDALFCANYNIVGVITAPDKPAGRGKKMTQSAVKKYALTHQLNLLQPTNLKHPDFLNSLLNLKSNLQIVVAFRMLPKQVWQIPSYGTFNLHASLLPEYRGAAPINWAIINGEEKTGVTTFFIDDKIDTGEIILQKETTIKPNDTVGTLHDKLMEIGSKLVLETVKLIEFNKVTTQKQPEKTTKAAPKIYTETCKIDWNNKAETIYNLIRGLNPYPAAWTYLINGENKVKVKLYDVAILEEQLNESPGTIIAKKDYLLVATQKGMLKIESLQIAGKRKMDAKSLLNGFSIMENAKFV
ncbi:MAG: methionyl-tRNA formyltransferase [Lutibacter sp.]